MYISKELENQFLPVLKEKRANLTSFFLGVISLQLNHEHLDRELPSSSPFLHAQFPLLNQQDIFDSSLASPKLLDFLGQAFLIPSIFPLLHEVILLRFFLAILLFLSQFLLFPT